MTRKFNIEPDWSIEDCHVAALLAMTWNQPDGPLNDVEKRKGCRSSPNE